MRTTQGARAWIIREAVELALLIGVLVGVSQFFPVPVWVFVAVVLAKILVAVSMYAFFLRKVFHRPISFGPEKLVGQIAETITALNPSGQIKADGEIWTALSQTGTMIPAQQKVRILEVRGTAVHVDPVE
jgi:membrane protein implicated in regulation of membrane protease activity